MRLPRWFVVTLLTASLLAVLVAGAWWWVTWPERTAHEFVSLLKTHKAEEALRMIPIHSTIDNQGSRWEFAGEGDPSTFQTRTLRDYIEGRCQFNIGILREIQQIQPGFFGSIVHYQSFVAKHGHIEYVLLTVD